MDSSAFLEPLGLPASMEKYSYKNKGKSQATFLSLMHLINAANLCLHTLKRISAE